MISYLNVFLFVFLNIKKVRFVMNVNNLNSFLYVAKIELKIRIKNGRFFYDIKSEFTD